MWHGMHFESNLPQYMFFCANTLGNLNICIRLHQTREHPNTVLEDMNDVGFSYKVKARKLGNTDYLITNCRLLLLQILFCLELIHNEASGGSMSRFGLFRNLATARIVCARVLVCVCMHICYKLICKSWTSITARWIMPYPILMLIPKLITCPNAAYIHSN